VLALQAPGTDAGSGSGLRLRRKLLSGYKQVKLFGCRVSCNQGCNDGGGGVHSGWERAWPVQDAGQLPS